jgi:mono/diheme cytochrome c family protein
MGFFDRHPRLKEFLLAMDDFFQHPFRKLWNGLKALGILLWAGISVGGRSIWKGARKQWVPICGFLAVVAALLVLLVVSYCGVAIYWERQMAAVAPPQQVVYLDQGWGGTQPTSDERLNFYYLPQGAFLKNIRYDWLANLERPWKEERFADPKYMRAYGFIVDTPQVKENPGGLPLGFSPRYDPKYNEMMLDLNCAVCHTGELRLVQNGQRTAVRIDGGPGHQDFTGQKAGQFGGDLAISLAATWFNPFKWRRFARAVLKDEDDSAHRRILSTELWETLGAIVSQARTESKLGIHPYPDGYGRTDGLAGIENAAFAVNLVESNYVVANAPVSYPFVWDIPWLNWVQYTTSVRQPMARNIGEAMGTGARYYLKDPFENPLPATERFDASLKLANLTHIESLLRTLRAPCWPEEVFGKIDVDKARQGRDLFYGKYHCVGCHGPHVAPAVYTAAEAPLKLEERNSLVNPNRNYAIGGPPPENWQIPPGTKPPYRLAHWIMTALPAQEIGTDVTSALNFFRDRFDLTKTGMTADEVRNELTPYWTTNYKRQLEYWSNLVVILHPTRDPKVDPVGDGPFTAAAIKGIGGTLREPVIPAADPGVQRSMYRSVATTRMRLAALSCAKSGKLFQILDTDEFFLGAPIQLPDLTPDELKNIGNPTMDTACTNLQGLVELGLDGYLKQNLGNINLNSTSGGEGLNYLITLVRKRAYQDMDVSDDNRLQQLDGYGQIDTPQSAVQYHARPLAGIWATAPFLHNGSVPSLYEMLLPAYRRTKKFYLKEPNFDPRAVGLYADESLKGAFLYDTTVPGNSNAGHEFRAGYRDETALGGMPMNGVIGPEMTDDERWAIIEYLKIKRDIYDPVCPEEKWLPAMQAAPPPATKQATKQAAAPAKRAASQAEVN